MGEEEEVKRNEVGVIVEDEPYKEGHEGQVDIVQNDKEKEIIDENGDNDDDKMKSGLIDNGGKDDKKMNDDNKVNDEQKEGQEPVSQSQSQSEEEIESKNKNKKCGKKVGWQLVKEKR